MLPARRLLGLALLGLLYCLTAGFRPAGLVADELPTTIATRRAVEALGTRTLPRVEAQAATLVDATTGQVLFAQAADEPLPPASTTKLMTALLVVETGRYFDEVRIMPADLVGGSSMGLVAGEVMSVRALLDGLLIRSGNDAAAALARHVGASLPGPGAPVERFVARMNARADELGLRHTFFRNPEGLDMAGHRMSAADLATLARVALEQPVIAQIVATPETTVRGARQTYVLRNSNELLMKYPGALGVKTGTTNAAGECLVALVERDGRRLLSVVLGSSDRYADSIALLDWGFAAHRWIEPPAGLAALAAPPGYSASLALGPPVVVPVEQVQFITYEVQPPPPGRLAETVLTIRVFDRQIATRAVVIYPLGRTKRPLPGW
jgi:D-alanyl-D-alanine carboxypeptidase (penicillin-binding protein 5/6)